MGAGRATMSNTDVVALLKVDTNLPEENKSINNIRRMDVLGSILLPIGHLFQKYIKTHLKELKAYMPK